MRPARLFVFALLAWTAVAAASTISPPSNLGDLARASRAVVLAEAGGAAAELVGGLPATVTRFETVRQVAGEAVGRRFDVVTPGGEVGEAGLAVDGSPRFEAGARYLLFLDRAPGGRWQTLMLSYGLLREDEGALRPVPEAARLALVERPGVEPVGVYRKDDLLAHLAGVAVGAPWHREAVAAETASQQGSGVKIAGAASHSAPAVCAFQRTQDDLPVRWFGFETGIAVSLWHTSPGQTGIADGGIAAIQQGAAAWSNHPDSAIHLTYGGSRAASANCSDTQAEQSGVPEVTFNDPCGQLPPLAMCSDTVPPGWSPVCCGQIAQGGVFYNPSATAAHDGETWRPVISPWVLVNDGAQCLGETDFREMVTHQIGHGLGFGHFNDSNATMYVDLGVHPSRGAAIADTDAKCAAAIYHTFRDVPLSYFAWRFVEAIENAGVTTGCGSGNYCPESAILRETMAVFLLTAKEGAGYTPPACTTPVFSDVPCSSPFAPWINELFNRGVVVGCGNGNYCPKNPVTREQMAVLLVKTFEGPSYVPPACTTPSFSDVPCSNPFSAWIKQLVDRGITAGCGPGLYCPANPVTRGQMSVFLSTTFSLPVPPAP